MKNRATRRATLQEAKRNLPKDLRALPREEWPASEGPASPAGAWVSKTWCVVLWTMDGAPDRLSVLANPPRHDVTWDELMNLKRAVGLGHRWAVEAYPADGEAVDVAPMRHLWLGRSCGDLRGRQ